MNKFYPEEMTSLLNHYKVSDSIDLAPKNPYETEITMVFDNTPSRESDILLKDSKMYNTGVSFPNETKNISLDLIEDTEKNLRFFTPLSSEDSESLISSIERYGLIYPVVLVKTDRGTYKIIDGRERFKSVKEIYSTSQNETFSQIKSIVFENNDLNILEEIDIRISLNINRKTSVEEKTRIVLTKIGIERIRKEKKNDINIMKKIASDLNMSVSSLYEYKLLSNCTEKTLLLIDRGQINLGLAKKMAKYSSVVQDKIIDTCGISDVRPALIKVLPKTLDEKSAEKMVKQFKELEYSYYSSLKIKGMRQDVLDLLEILKLVREKNRYKNMDFIVSNLELDFTVGFNSNDTKRTSYPSYYKNKFPEKFLQEIKN